MNELAWIEHTNEVIAKLITLLHEFTDATAGVRSNRIPANVVSGPQAQPALEDQDGIRPHFPFLKDEAIAAELMEHAGLRVNYGRAVSREKHAVVQLYLHLRLPGQPPTTSRGRLMVEVCSMLNLATARIAELRASAAKWRFVPRCVPSLRLHPMTAPRGPVQISRSRNMNVPRTFPGIGHPRVGRCHVAPNCHPGFRRCHTCSTG